MTSALWQHRGMACAAQISPAGIPCGYVGVPEGHPWYRVAYYDINGVDDHDDDALRLALLFITGSMRAESVTEAEVRAEVERLAEQAAQAMAR